MKRKFKQQWTAIPPISTKRTITSHLKSLNIKRSMEIHVLAWTRHKNVAGLSWLMGYQILTPAKFKEPKLIR
jgi:hypothetical protein